MMPPRTYKSFSAIYALVKEVPKGQVASYGMIASLIPGATARIVGYAMAATPQGENIPWQRVINAAGKVSDRDGAARQQTSLKEEGVTFTKADKISWKTFGWQGPGDTWLDKNKIDFIEYLEIQSKWPNNR